MVDYFLRDPLVLTLGVITLFPQMFNALHHGVIGRAIDRKLVQINYWNIRDYGVRSYRKVDDTPYGGGPGMVMMYQPIVDAIKDAKVSLPAHTKVIYLSPQGRLVSQQVLAEIAREMQPLLFVAGRYEGIDERIITNFIDEEWSLGDFVLSGGEFAAMSIIDGIVRLLPQSLGNVDSALQDSFVTGLFDYPQYTKPAIIDGVAVPKVLLSGDHKSIQNWRRQQSLGKTWLKRPALLYDKELSAADEKLLNQFKNEYEFKEV